MQTIEHQKITSEKAVEDVSGKEEIAEKIEALKKQEGIKKLEREFGEVGDMLEKIANDPVLKDETVSPEQKRNFWDKTRKIRVFMPLVISGVMSLAGLFGKGNAEGQNLNKPQNVDSWNNLAKVGQLMSDIDQKQHTKNKKDDIADPYGNYKLNMRVKTKKDKNHIINSDQWNGGKNTPFPSELSEMNGYYTIGHKRIPLDKLFKTLERRSYQILKDENNKYFLNLPVSNSFFYELKCKVKKIVHSENQTTDDRFDICALDSGIRTFQTLYGLNHIVEIGSNDCYKILKRLKIGDRSFGLKKKLIGKKIKNLVDDLHRKTISFLTSNYKIILLPNFGTSGMLGGKISKGTKREMQAFRFYNFKQRLIDKCAKTGTVLKIVSEAYTTQCCSECGVLTNPNDSKIFMCLNMNCPLFRVEIDRDFQGGRNVFIRNVSLAF